MKRIIFTSFIAASLGAFGAFAQVGQTTSSDSNQTTIVKDHGKKVETNSNRTNSYADSTGANDITTTSKHVKTKRHHGKEVTHTSQSQTTTTNP